TVSARGRYPVSRLHVRGQAHGESSVRGHKNVPARKARPAGLVGHDRPIALERGKVPPQGWHPIAADFIGTATGETGTRAVARRGKYHGARRGDWQSALPCHMRDCVRVRVGGSFPEPENPGPITVRCGEEPVIHRPPGGAKAENKGNRHEYEK